MTNSIIEQTAELIRKISLELVFAEAGKDNGLLPVNSLLIQLEELAQANPFPAPMLPAVAAARQAVSAVFDRDCLFDAANLRRLQEWIAWMEPACEAWQHEHPLSALPASWNSAALPAPPSAAVPAPVQPPGPSASVPSASEANAEVPLVLTLEADAELLREFVAESQEHLQNIELGVLVLEDNPTDADTLNSIFRAFHTFKGGSGFLRLTPVNHLAHELESLLDLARQGKLLIQSDIINVILEGGDRLKQFVGAIDKALAAGHAEPLVIPIRPLIARVRAAGTGASAPPALAASSTAPAVAASADAAAPVSPAASEPQPGAPAPAAAAAASAKAGPAKAASDGSFIRVDTHKLDSLMDLVGELVIAQSLVAQDESLSGLQNQRLTRNLAQLRGITNELQKSAMSLRMVPVRGTFQKMTRLVRDLAAKQGKQVELQMSGEDTELDRTITEELTDPLVHMIRNSMDHGIEKPEVRVSQGKKPQGTIFLRASHEGGNIVVEVQDDGAGLNKERLLAKAVEKGLVRPGEELSEKEIHDLIFAPGFSTAEKITDLSGRGVGMDVVRRNVEKMRGQIAIASTPGKGTTFTISLPLTLAIIDGFIVGVGQERFILPTYAVREAFRPKPEMLATLHERGEMVNVRGRLSPLLRLYDYFGVEAAATDPTQGILLLVESENDHRCLLVDQLLGKQEVVIKSLGETFKQSHAIAGAAILGDGRVGLILDVNTMVKLKTRPLVEAA